METMNVLTIKTFKGSQLAAFDAVQSALLTAQLDS